MCLNHPVSERISSSGHFCIYIVHTTRVMRYFIHTEVVAQIFKKMGQIQVKIFKFWSILKKFVREGYLVNIKSVFALFFANLLQILEKLENSQEVFENPIF